MCCMAHIITFDLLSLLLAEAWLKGKCNTLPMSFYDSSSVMAWSNPMISAFIGSDLNLKNMLVLNKAL